MKVKALRELLSDYDDDQSVIVITDDATATIHGITDTDENVVILAQINQKHES